MLKHRVVRRSQPSKNKRPDDSKVDSSGDHESSSSGVISDQSSSTIGRRSLGGSSTTLRDVPSDPGVSLSMSMSTTCLHRPPPQFDNPPNCRVSKASSESSVSVHWGETMVHEYAIEDPYSEQFSSEYDMRSDVIDIDVEQVMEEYHGPPRCSSVSSDSTDCSIGFMPHSASNMELGQVPNRRYTPQRPPRFHRSLRKPAHAHSTAQRYIETNLDESKEQCPACLFDCSPIHPYLSNLQPHQCHHEGDSERQRVPREPPPHTCGSSSESSYGPLSVSSMTSSTCRPRRRLVVGVDDGSTPELSYKHHMLQERFYKNDTRSTSNSAEANSSFSSMSDDLLLKVLGYLPTRQVVSCARVCKRWYTCAWDVSLLTELHLENNPQIDANKALRTLTKILSYATYPVCLCVERVHLASSATLTDRGLFSLAKRCPELRYLDIRDCPQITNLSVFEVVSKCVNLEVLKAAGCPLVSCVSLTPEAQRQAPSPTGNRIFLRQLDLSSCQRLDDGGLSIVASHCTELTHVHLRRCDQITDSGVHYLARYCSQLQYISLAECPRLTDFTMDDVALLGKNLRHLSVARCPKITDAGVASLSKKCSKLRYLNLKGCVQISDCSLDNIAMNCSKLRSFDVGECDISDDGLLQVGRHCKQLRRLSLKSCDAVTDTGVLGVARGCPSLQLLNVQQCSVTVSAYRSIRQLCKRCIIEHTNPAF